jgi:hypothetical protein
MKIREFFETARTEHLRRGNSEYTFVEYWRVLGRHMKLKFRNQDSWLDQEITPELEGQIAKFTERILRCLANKKLNVEEWRELSCSEIAELSEALRIASNR